MRKGSVTMLIRYLVLKIIPQTRSEWAAFVMGLLLAVSLGLGIAMCSGCSLGQTTATPDAGIAACPVDAGALACTREGMCTYDGKPCEREQGSGSL
jgi:hypothetical protein